jgi:hypothetical protein
MEKRKALSRPLSQREGFEHIANYYRSGLRPSEYYTQHEISEWQFYSWRRRYLAIHPQEETSANSEKNFHPLRIESTTGDIRISGLEIHYPHGVRVVIGNDHPVEIATLLELLKLRM